jgi:hypothetical protein
MSFGEGKIIETTKGEMDAMLANQQRLINGLEKIRQCCSTPILGEWTPNNLNTLEVAYCLEQSTKLLAGLPVEKSFTEELESVENETENTLSEREKEK